MVVLPSNTQERSTAASNTRVREFRNTVAVIGIGRPISTSCFGQVGTGRRILRRNVAWTISRSD